MTEISSAVGIEAHTSDRSELPLLPFLDRLFAPAPLERPLLEPPARCIIGALHRVPARCPVPRERGRPVRSATFVPRFRRGARLAPGASGDRGMFPTARARVVGRPPTRVRERRHGRVRKMVLRLAAGNGERGPRATGRRLGIRLAPPGDRLPGRDPPLRDGLPPPRAAFFHRALPAMSVEVSRGERRRSAGSPPRREGGRAPRRLRGRRRHIFGIRRIHVARAVRLLPPRRLDPAPFPRPRRSALRPGRRRLPGPKLLLELERRPLPAPRDRFDEPLDRRTRADAAGEHEQAARRVAIACGRRQRTGHVRPS
jgi:hypothetical protein